VRGAGNLSASVAIATIYYYNIYGAQVAGYSGKHNQAMGRPGASTAAARRSGFVKRNYHHYCAPRPGPGFMTDLLLSSTLYTVAGVIWMAGQSEKNCVT
jgi:hypothetical protein